MHHFGDISRPLALALICGAGCATPRVAQRAGAATRSEELVTVRNSSAPAGSSAPTRGVEETPEPVPEPTVERTPDFKEFPYAEAFPEARRQNVDEWLKAHGVDGHFEEKKCWDTDERVGLPNAPGLFCEAETARPPRKTSRLYRLEGKRLRVVWEATVGTYANWLELTPTLSRDGGTLTLIDAAKGGCENALCESKAKLESNVQPHWLAEIVAKACAARGLYEWKERSYVLVQLPPPVEVKCTTEVFL